MKLTDPPLGDRLDQRVRPAPPIASGLERGGTMSKSRVMTWRRERREGPRRRTRRERAGRTGRGQPPLPGAASVLRPGSAHTSRGRSPHRWPRAVLPAPQSCARRCADAGGLSDRTDSERGRAPHPEAESAESRRSPIGWSYTAAAAASGSRSSSDRNAVDDRRGTHSRTVPSWWRQAAVQVSPRYARRMSSESRSSEAEPDSTTWPVYNTKPRRAMLSAIFAFCSTTRIGVPCKGRRRARIPELG